MTQKSPLGKGLSSLLPSRPPQIPPKMGTGAEAAGPPTVATQNYVEPNAKDSNQRIPGIAMVSTEEIVANEYQPRRDFHDDTLEELAQSVRENGIIQPLIVRRTTTGYELIAGERRLRAAKKVGLKQVPVVVRRSTDKESLELALIENIQREDLNCVDTALAYQQLAEEFSLTQEEIAKKVGKDRASVSNHLRLLKLPLEIVDDLKKQIMSFGHGKALLALESRELRLKARALVIEKKLSVRETEDLVAQLQGPKDKKSQTAESNEQTPVTQRLKNLSVEISHALGCRAQIKGSDQSGKIILSYHSREELDRVLEFLK